MGAAHVRARHASRPGDRVRHHAVERALPQVTGQQPDQELALSLRRPAQQARQQPAPLSLRALPGQRADLAERRVGLGQSQLWLGTGSPAPARLGPVAAAP